MTPAQAQYAEFGANLPNTGINLTAVFIVAVIYIAAGALALFTAYRRGVR